MGRTVTGVIGCHINTINQTDFKLISGLESVQSLWSSESERLDDSIEARRILKLLYPMAGSFHRISKWNHFKSLRLRFIGRLVKKLIAQKWSTHSNWQSKLIIKRCGISVCRCECVCSIRAVVCRRWDVLHVARCPPFVVALLERRVTEGR